MNSNANADEVLFHTWMGAEPVQDIYHAVQLVRLAVNWQLLARVVKDRPLPTAIRQALPAPCLHSRACARDSGTGLPAFGVECSVSKVHAGAGQHQPNATHANMSTSSNAE
jgi:hypothetical protein